MWWCLGSNPLGPWHSCWGAWKTPYQEFKNDFIAKEVQDNLRAAVRRMMPSNVRHCLEDCSPE